MAQIDCPEAARYRPTEILLDVLDQAIRGLPNTKVVPLHSAISQEEGSAAARKAGEQSNASIVIWGWIGHTEETALLHLRYEILSPVILAVLDVIDLSPVLKVPASELQDFTLQDELAASVATVVLAAIGGAQFCAGNWLCAARSLSRAACALENDTRVEEAAIVRRYAGIAWLIADSPRAAASEFMMVIHPEYPTSVGAEFEAVTHFFTKLPVPLGGTSGTSLGLPACTTPLEPGPDTRQCTRVDLVDPPYSMLELPDSVETGRRQGHAEQEEAGVASVFSVRNTIKYLGRSRVPRNWGIALTMMGTRLSGAAARLVLREACEDFQRSCEANPHDSPTLDYWGIALRVLAAHSDRAAAAGLLRVADSVYARATAADSLNALNFLNRGCVLYALAKAASPETMLPILREAASMLARAVMLEPALAEAHLVRGTVLREVAERVPRVEAAPTYKEGLDALARYMALRPADAIGHYHYGTTLLRSTEALHVNEVAPARQMAVQVLRNATQLDPEVAELHYALGLGLAALAEVQPASRARELYKESTSSFSRAIQLRDYYSEAYAGWADAVERLSDLVAEGERPALQQMAARLRSSSQADLRNNVLKSVFWVRGPYEGPRVERGRLVRSVLEYLSMIDTASGRLPPRHSAVSDLYDRGPFRYIPEQHRILQ